MRIQRFRELFADFAAKSYFFGLYSIEACSPNTSFYNRQAHNYGKYKIFNFDFAPKTGFWEFENWFLLNNFFGYSPIIETRVSQGNFQVWLYIKIDHVSKGSFKNITQQQAKEIAAQAAEPTATEAPATIETPTTENGICDLANLDNSLLAIGEVAPQSVEIATETPAPAYTKEQLTTDLAAYQADPENVDKLAGAYVWQSEGDIAHFVGGSYWKQVFTGDFNALIDSLKTLNALTVQGIILDFSDDWGVAYIPTGVLIYTLNMQICILTAQKEILTADKKDADNLENTGELLAQKPKYNIPKYVPTPQVAPEPLTAQNMMPLPCLAADTTPTINGTTKGYELIDEFFEAHEVHNDGQGSYFERNFEFRFGGKNFAMKEFFNTATDQTHYNIYGSDENGKPAPISNLTNLEAYNELFKLYEKNAPIDASVTEYIAASFLEQGVLKCGEIIFNAGLKTWEYDYYKMLLTFIHYDFAITCTESDMIMLVNQDFGLNTDYILPQKEMRGYGLGAETHNGKFATARNIKTGATIPKGRLVWDAENEQYLCRALDPKTKKTVCIVVDYFTPFEYK